MSALDLLSGDAQTFLEKVWASRTHLHHTDPERLVGLLTLDDVDHLLTGTAIRTPAVRVARDGSVLPASAFTRPATLAGQPMTGLVDPRKVFDLVDDGATVVLQGLHRYWAPLGALVADLELELGHPCQANAYLTPPGSQGFAVHSDTHDVFVFQTHGTKVWGIGRPGEPDAEPQEVVLEPGVSLYLPTGTPHSARAQDTASLHVTIGINQVTWAQVLDRAVAGVRGGADDEHLPAGYLDDPARLAAGLAAPPGGAGRRAARPGPGRGRGRRGAALPHRPHPRPARRPHRPAGGPRGRRRHHPGAPARAPVRAGRGGGAAAPAARRPGAHPARAPARPPWSWSARRGTFRPADLADQLDAQSRLVLCRRLVREGLLRAIG